MRLLMTLSIVLVSLGVLCYIAALVLMFYKG